MLKLSIVLCFLFLKSFAFDLDDVEYEKMPPLFALDDYDRCLLFNGTYCVIKTELFAEPDNQLMSMMKSYTKSSHIKHYNHTYQNKGICLTTACRAFIGDKDLNSHKNIQEILETCENQTIYEKFGLQAKVSDIFYCDIKETRVDKKDLLDWIVVALIAFIILVNLTATFYESTLDEKSKTKMSYGEKMLLCFSIKRNWNYLVAPLSTDPKEAKLQGINFIRTSSSFAMIMGHVVWIQVMGFMDNPHDFERSYDDTRYQFIYNGMIVVQIFFVISGFLLIYNLEKSAKRRISWRELPTKFMHRIFRLAPPMAVMIAFNATWVRFVNSGPLWKLYVVSMVNDCRKWWWSHLLFINNYLTDNKYCAIQTWHTAADTQIFLVAITLYVLVKPRARGLVTIFCFLLGMVIPALHVYYQDLNAQMMKTPEMLRSLVDPNRYPYVFSHNNICCFLLGMVTAYLVCHGQQKGITLSEKVTKFVYAVAVPWFLICFKAGYLFHEEDYRTPLWIRMLWQGTHRLFLGLLIAALLACMTLGPQVSTSLSSIMKWPVFRITAKLSYAVFLLHETFTHIVAGSKTTLVHFDYLSLLIYQLGIFALTYLISVPFYLMVEAPMNPLVNIILKKRKLEDEKIIPDPKQNGVADVILKTQEGQEKTTEENAIENAIGSNDLTDQFVNYIFENVAPEDVKVKAS